MAFHEKEVPANASAGEKVLAWVDSRLPVTEAFKRHMSEYYAPKNLNFFYIFGALAIVTMPSAVKAVPIVAKVVPSKLPWKATVAMVIPETCRNAG